MCSGLKADSQGQSPGEDFCYKVSRKIAGAQQFLFSKAQRENRIGVDSGLCGAPLQVAAYVWSLLIRRLERVAAERVSREMVGKLGLQPGSPEISDPLAPSWVRGGGFGATDPDFVPSFAFS